MASLIGEPAVGYFFQDWNSSGSDGDFNYNVPAGKYARLTLKDFHIRVSGGFMDLGFGIFQATSATSGDPDEWNNFVVVGPTNIKIYSGAQAKIFITLHNTP
ncbi:MAG: hypothetical protein CME63_01610 [Halobacteriovoraceae bacterium]|nr:hypothetical protein [Halobacteriovoraceae bacterium]|tara:strand:+ start:44720 stop:45025 length:306 start_codon:yes stop_codon:yes gene_type:complete